MTVSNLIKKARKVWKKTLGNKKGSLDLRSLLDAIMIIVLLPSLISVLGSLGGIDTSMLEPFLNILPIVALFSAFADIFSGLGGKAGSAISKFMDIIMLLAVFPALISALSNFTGGTIDTSIFDVFLQLLPLIMIFELFSDILGK